MALLRGTYGASPAAAAAAAPKPETRNSGTSPAATTAATTTTATADTTKALLSAKWLWNSSHLAGISVVVAVGMLMDLRSERGQNALLASRA